MSLYCNNCGNEGHLYRQCRLPVLSYGILILNSDNHLLMIRRKDSLIIHRIFTSVNMISQIVSIFNRY